MKCNFILVPGAGGLCEHVIADGTPRVYTAQEGADHDNCFKVKQITNADRIRSMSDEELAEDAYLIQMVHGRDMLVSLFDAKPFAIKSSVIQHNLDRLSQPAAEDED